MTGACFPLSGLQQSIWLSEQRRGLSPLWNITLQLRLRGALRRDLLSEALHQVLRRHAILHMRFGEAAGEPFQCVVPDGTGAAIVRHDLSGVLDENLLEARAAALAREPFDLRNDCPTRVDLFALGDHDTVLLLRFHHIVTDGMAMNQFIAELGERYRELLSGAQFQADNRYDYIDWIERERAPEWRQRLRAGADYWRRQLRDAPTFIDFGQTCDIAVSPNTGGIHHFAINAAVTAELESLARDSGSGITVVLLSCLQALIGRITGSSDLIIGLTVNGRVAPETRAMQGLFANILPIRATIDWDISFNDFLQQQKDIVRSALAWQDIPLDKIIGECVDKRRGDHHPLIQVSLNYWSPQPDLFAVPSVTATCERVEAGQARFELSLKVVRSRGALECAFEFDVSHFTEGQVATITARFTRMLEGLRRTRSEPLRLQSYLLDSETSILDKAPPHPHPGASVLAFYQDTVAQDRHALAILDGDRCIDRITLDRCSTALARQLCAFGISPETPIALMLPRGAAMIMAQLAVVKAGASFIPLDPDTPPDRLRSILEKSAARLIIADENTAVADGRMLPVLQLRSPPMYVEGKSGSSKILDQRPEPLPDQLAYIIFTSGSTGEPKGVMIEHQSLTNLVKWYQRAYQVRSGSRISQLAAPGFDSTIYETWPGLCAGAVLIPAPAGLSADAQATRDWLVAEQIEIAFAPTPLGERLVALAWPEHTALKWLQIGGDRLVGRPPNGLPFAVVNSYGPAEGTVVSSEGVVAPRPTLGPPGIGVPIDNVELLVLDSAGVAVPRGAPGELHISGINLARGYLGEPELTALRFMVHDRYAGRRLYRTGDIGRCREIDGQFECLGRLDRQVKIRGQRIEIGEVEHALLDVREISEATVIHRPGRDGTGELTAYLVCAGVLDPVDLRARLRQRLTIAMIPARFVFVDQMPLTINGKVDYRRLCEIEATAALPAANRRINLATLAGTPPTGQTLTRLSPDTNLLRTVTDVWCDILDLPEIPIDSNFFDLGGHSLLAVRIVGELRDRTGIDLTMRAFFQNPTIAALAAWITEAAAYRKQKEPDAPNGTHHRTTDNSAGDREDHST